MCYKQKIGYDYQGNIESKSYDRIFVTCGTMDKIKPSDIVEFLVSYGKIKKSDIGEISIKRKFSFVDIHSDVSHQVIQNCNKQKIKQRKIGLEFSGSRS